MLSRKQQDALITVANKGDSEIDKVVALIKAESPEKFHTNDSLRFRRFFRQPNPETRIPYAGFVVGFPTVKRQFDDGPGREY